MLTVTDQAAAMIARLREEADPSGELALRIARRSGSPGLTMTLTDHPGPDDMVLQDSRATVFLDPVAAARLDDEILDARSNEVGSAFFLG